MAIAANPTRDQWNVHTQIAPTSFERSSIGGKISLDIICCVRRPFLSQAQSLIMKPDMKIDEQCPICRWKGFDANEYMKHAKYCEKKAVTVDQRNEAVSKRRAIVKQAGHELDSLRNHQVKVNPKRRIEEEPIGPSKVRVMESLSSIADMRRGSQMTSLPKHYETTDNSLSLNPGEISGVESDSSR